MSRYNLGRGLPTWNGVPMVGGVPVTEGNYFFVDYGSGSDSVNTKSNSISRAFKTIDKALDLATTNKNDVICLVGNSTHVLTEMLDVSKNRVHLVGLDGTNRRYGQGAKVSLGVTTAATDIGTVKNTGVRNSFQNIKFINENTVAEGLYCFVEGGEYTVLDSCEIYKSTDLDGTGAAELVMNGDSAQVRSCVIGSSANIVADNIIRANVLLTKGLAGSGKVCRDTTFEDCLLLSKAGGTEHVDVYGANADDVERMLLMERCIFMNNVLSAATPAHAVGFGAAQTAGTVLLKDCASVDHTVMAEAAVGIYVAGAVPTFATSGVSVTA